LKNLTKFALLFSLASAFCFGETYSGRLVDSSCKAKAQQSGEKMSCAATKVTTNFGVETPDGKTLNLDADGNSKAIEAIKDSKSADVRVSVTGSITGDGGLKVESITVQQ
jgi:hypothetical protein